MFCRAVEYRSRQDQPQHLQYRLLKLLDASPPGQEALSKGMCIVRLECGQQILTAVCRNKTPHIVLTEMNCNLADELSQKEMF